MSDIVIAKHNLPAMSNAAIEKVRRLEKTLLNLQPVDIETIHTLHGGLYSRTIRIPAGVVLTGVLIKIPTTLIVSGKVTVFIGEQAIELAGYNVLSANAGRKQAFTAHSDTYLTMIFPSKAETIEQAENEFTDEVDALGSRRNTSRNVITITGEHLCPDGR